MPHGPPGSNAGRGEWPRGRRVRSARRSQPHGSGEAISPEGKAAGCGWWWRNHSSPTGSMPTRGAGQPVFEGDSPMSLLWINGTLTDKLAAKVSPFDHGFLYGDGVWEH